jgi:hypothetical protein
VGSSDTRLPVRQKISLLPIEAVRATGMAAMQKWKLVILATTLAIAGLIFGLFHLARQQEKARATPIASTSPSVRASEPAQQAKVDSVSRPSDPGHESATSSNGPPAPQLPATAPNDVTFGAILFAFEGAEGAPVSARSKTSALEAAKRLLPTAQSDFEQAAKQGDRGSTANAGSIRRGILEPSLEYALFTLEKGAVYPEPVETPRGYWIMRRIR